MPSESIDIAAPCDKVWGMVSDVTRMGQWSPETVSGEWLDGAGGPAVGARFRGRNKRRGPWTTTSRVTSATPGTDVKLFATALGVGILIDATVVRALLVPALVGLLGRWNWWLPAWPARLLRVQPSPLTPTHPAGSAQPDSDRARARVPIH